MPLTAYPHAKSVIHPWNLAQSSTGLPHMVEDAGTGRTHYEPPVRPHPFGMQNPDGTDAAAAARDAAAAARGAAAAVRDVAAAARDAAFV